MAEVRRNKALKDCSKQNSSALNRISIPIRLRWLKDCVKKAHLPFLRKENISRLGICAKLHLPDSRAESSLFSHPQSQFVLTLFLRRHKRRGCSLIQFRTIFDFLLQPKKCRTAVNSSHSRQDPFVCRRFRFVAHFLYALPACVWHRVLCSGGSLRVNRAADVGSGVAKFARSTWWCVFCV